jgi:hypothetical protein
VFNRHNARETSLAATSRLKVGTAKAKVYAAIKERPMTDDELVRATGLKQNTARPRRVDLLDDGLVVDSGLRRDGMTVWCIADD